MRIGKLIGILAAVFLILFMLFNWQFFFKIYWDCLDIRSGTLRGDVEKSMAEYWITREDGTTTHYADPTHTVYCWVDYNSVGRVVGVQSAKIGL